MPLSQGSGWRRSVLGIRDRTTSGDSPSSTVAGDAIRRRGLLEGKGSDLRGPASTCVKLHSAMEDADRQSLKLRKAI